MIERWSSYTVQLLELLKQPKDHILILTTDQNDVFSWFRLIGAATCTVQTNPVLLLLFSSVFALKHLSNLS